MLVQPDRTLYGLLRSREIAARLGDMRNVVERVQHILGIGPLAGVFERLSEE